MKTLKPALRFWTPSALLMAVLLLSPAMASADKFDETLDVSLHIGGGSVDGKGFEIDPEVKGRTAQRLLDEGLRIKGQGKVLDLTLRGGLSFDGFRFGLGLGTFTASGLSTERDGVSGGIDTEATGLQGELYAGWAMGSPRGIRPYVEILGQGRFMAIEVESGGEVANFWAQGFGLLGRTGVLVGINQYFFADVGASLSLAGAPSWGASVAIGLPIPLSNL